MKKLLFKSGKYFVNLNLAIIGIGVFQYLFNDKISEKNLKLNKTTYIKLINQDLNFDVFKKNFSLNSLDSYVYSEVNPRKEQIKNLQEENFDFLIIGGGSAGAGVLLDAYTRGFNCALIEANDFASGTSSKSSKLVFGGLKNFEQAFAFDWKIPIKQRLLNIYQVRQNMIERNFILDSATFMNEIIEFKIKAKNSYDLLMYYYGTFVYELFYYLNTNPKKYKFTFPKFDFYGKNIFIKEGRFNDTRQNVLSIMTCATQNYIPEARAASIANYLEFRNYLYDENYQVCGVNAFDKIKKKEIRIKSKIIINATGYSIDQNFSDIGELKNKIQKLIKGTHLVFHNLSIPYAIMIPKTADGKSILIVPFNEEYTIAGIAEVIELDKNQPPIPKQKEEDYIIKELDLYSRNNALPSQEKKSLCKDYLNKNISSKFSGYIGNLEKTKINIQTTNMDNSNKYNKKISSNPNILYDRKTNLYNILGSSWTLYRKSGNQLVNLILENEPELRTKELINNNSLNLRLKGCPDNINPYIIKKRYYTEKIFYKSLVEDLEKIYNINKEVLNSLIKRHGVNSIKILFEGEKTNSNKIAFENFLISEIRYLIRNEMAVKPNDILCRRLNIGFLNDKILLEAIPIVSVIIKDELKFSDTEMKIKHKYLYQ